MPVNDADLLLMPDSPLRRVALEVESHVGADGWDQPARLYALVVTADLIAQEPQLAEQLGDSPGELTPIEQEGLPFDVSLEDALGGIEWPEAVVGCAAVVERVMLPPDAEDAMPTDPDEAMAFAAAHPERREVRLVAAVTRDGAAHSAVRGREPATSELLEGPDLVPGLVGLLRATLA